MVSWVLEGLYKKMMKKQLGSGRAWRAGAFLLLGISGGFPAITHGQIFVSSAGTVTNSAYGHVGEYDLAGNAINSTLVPSVYGGAYGLAAVNGNLYVSTAFLGVSEYNSAGSAINTTLIPATNTYSLTVSGPNLYLVSFGPGNGNGSIGQYTLSGSVIQSSLITGLTSPEQMTVAGTNLFEANYKTGTVGRYTTTGGTVNTSFLTGLSFPTGLALSGDGADLFVASYTGDTIAEYNASTGALINPALISGLQHPESITISGNDLYVVNYSGGTVGEYLTNGTSVNPTLISGLYQPQSVAVNVPEPSSLALLMFLGVTVGARRRFKTAGNSRG